MKKLKNILRKVLQLRNKEKFTVKNLKNMLQNYKKKREPNMSKTN